MIIRKSSIFIFCLPFLFFSTWISAEIPAGYYYYAEGKKKEELKTALHEIAYPQFVLKYGNGKGHIWEGFYYADRNEEDNSVIDMYSPTIRYFNQYRGVEGMHIEHSFPKSWWGGGEYMAYRDLHHLFPSDGTTNMSKSNNPLGIVEGIPTTDNGVSKVGRASYLGYQGNVFEPDDEYKGDFARAYLYVATIYQDLTHLWKSPMLDNNTYPAWKPWAIDLLIDWHKQDPVSQKELKRQEVVYDIQGNRNPFIDYPDLVDYIWGAKTTTAYPFPLETNPFLASPRPNQKLNFNVIMQGDLQTKNLFIHGVNMTSDLTVELKNSNPVFTVNPQNISQDTAENGIDTYIRFKPSSPGSFIDTLLINGGGLAEARMIPVQGIASRTFLVLNAEDSTPVGAKLAWIKDPEATDYLLTIYQGASQAGDLIISSYIEGTNYNKAIELYNGTGKTIDLSDYSIMKQSNGLGPFTAPLMLEGNLPNNHTYLIAHQKVDNELQNKADLLDGDAAMNFNGNDAIALYNNGILIDMVGYPDVGPDLYWGQDKTLKRKTSITHPSVDFNEDEWDVYPINFFDLVNTHSIDFETSETIVLNKASMQTATTYTVSNLYPELKYNYYVEAILPNQTKKSANTMQFKTAGLMAPEVNAAKNIGPTFFTANWEDDLYTNDYLLNVFKYEGDKDTTVIEGFDDLGSKGEPLPKGWIGKVGGWYDTDASSGDNRPSLRLDKDGQYIQTKEFPFPVKEFSFLYKFQSASGNTHFIVEALSDNKWEEIDHIIPKGASKITLSYTFDSEDKVSALRITLHKDLGNLALDDFTITYGNLQKINILQDKPVTGNELFIESLNSNTKYYYTVKSILANSISPESDVVEVHTDTISGIKDKTFEVNILRTPNGIKLSGLKGGETINLYTITGVLIKQEKIYQNEFFLPLKSPDIYILHIQHDAYLHRQKILR